MRKIMYEQQISEIMGKQSVAIVSGGIDSVTMLYEYANTIDLVLSFDYGASINKMEIPFALHHCLKLGINHKTISLDFIKDNFHSRLLDKSDATDVVPFRNGIMLSIACAFAENLGLKYVLIANNNGDQNNYPDCRTDFIKNMSDGFKCGTNNSVEIFAPYSMISKSDILKRGINYGVDYSRTYSCYDGGDIHCGKCNACQSRKIAFLQSNLIDPTHYEKQ